MAVAVAAAAMHDGRPIPARSIEEASVASSLEPKSAGSRAGVGQRRILGNLGQVPKTCSVKGVDQREFQHS